MKVKINSNGTLEIWRKSKYAAAMCPFATSTYQISNGGCYCSDQCALFREKHNPNNELVRIELCQGQAFMHPDQLCDERR